MVTPGDYHSKRRIQVCDVAERLCGYLRQSQFQEEGEKSEPYRYHRRRAKHLQHRFNVLFAGYEDNSVSPHDEVENSYECGEIEHALHAEQRVHERNAHESAV